jgi:hypothetical protein
MTSVNVNIEIPESALCDLLTTAWEGGSDFWTPSYDARAIRRGGEPNDLMNHLDVVQIIFHTPGGDEEFNEPVKCEVIGPHEIGFAIAKVLNGTALAGKHILEDIHSNIEELGACDADTADVLLQVATFGEIVYG